MGQPLTGRTVSHYRILEALGEGGMGVVYRGEDPRLGRPVAVKVLAERFADDPEALARFLTEARAASALNHPGICTVYDVGVHEGQPYLVMELLRGRTLDAVVADGPLPVESCLELGVQLTDALAAAHAAGVVHCDIKPGNLVLTEHGLKILDFGLATALRADTAALTTTRVASDSASPGTRRVMGTLPYMSPEQVRGEAVDARTDVFSCGATLYEMATGRRAFGGSTVEVIVDALLRRDPVHASEIDPRLPDVLSPLLAGALAKDRAERYASMSDLRTDLVRLRRELGVGAAPTPPHPDARHQPSRPGARTRRVALGIGGAALAGLLAWTQWDRWWPGPARRAVGSIAVLPFTNATGDAEMEYLSDGLTVRLINTLADVGSLQVKSRAAAFRYKGRTDDPRVLGRELQVDALLTGSVTRRGDRLVVDAELVDVASGNQSWGDQFSGNRADVFALEDDIARGIAKELALELAPEAEQRYSRRYTRNLRAYELYLRGVHLAGTFRREGLERAIALYREALALDPQYALAYTGLAHAFFWFTDWYAPSQEVSPPALEAARRALEIDDGLSDAHAMLGLVTLVYVWDWGAAEQAFQRALALDAADARTRAYHAWLLSALGRREDAASEALRAQQIDPSSLEAATVAALALYLARRYDQAAHLARTVVQADPSLTWAHITLGRALQAGGRLAEGLPLLERAVQLEPALSEALAALGHAYAEAGRPDDARAILGRLRELATTQYVSPLDFATVHAGLGERREALDWLERAYERRAYLMPFIDALPFFDGLDADTRFETLLGRLNLPRPDRRMSEATPVR